MKGKKEGNARSENGRIGSKYFSTQRAYDEKGRGKSENKEYVSEHINISSKIAATRKEYGLPGQGFGVKLGYYLRRVRVV
jgi:hypothetical protein